MFEKLNKEDIVQVNTTRGKSMKVKIVSKNENLLLKRREVYFQVEHNQTGSTPPRLEVRKAIASALKTDTDLVFVKKFETKTGTHIAVGVANVYDSVEQAKLTEPGYVIKRNAPPEKPEEEGKE
ncbi:MAG: 30S ribosomal protein S24e [Candidatus Bathyarchaeota archaeon]|nr:30S ribosomal protein S24e [Candidatus Bathyarchaeota archaeon]